MERCLGCVKGPLTYNALLRVFKLALYVPPRPGFYDRRPREQKNGKELLQVSLHGFIPLAILYHPARLFCTLEGSGRLGDDQGGTQWLSEANNSGSEDM